MCFEHIRPLYAFPRSTPFPTHPILCPLFCYPSNPIRTAYIFLHGQPSIGGQLTSEGQHSWNWLLLSQQLLVANCSSARSGLHAHLSPPWRIWAFMRVFLKTVLLYSLGGPQNHGGHASASQETESAGLCPFFAQVQCIVKITTAATSESWAFRCVTCSS